MRHWRLRDMLTNKKIRASQMDQLGPDFFIFYYSDITATKLENPIPMSSHRQYRWSGLWYKQNFQMQITTADHTILRFCLVWQ